MGEVAAGASDEKVIATAIREGAVLLPPLRGMLLAPSWSSSAPARFSQSPPLWAAKRLDRFLSLRYSPATLAPAE